MMGLPVQLFTILILVTLPIIFMQFVSARMPLMSGDETVTFASTETVYQYVKQKPEDISATKKVVAFQGDDLFLLYDEIEGAGDDVDNPQLTSLEVDKDVEHSIFEPVVNKKVRLVKGKQHVQGMEFLSIVLMLKEKQK